MPRGRGRLADAARAGPLPSPVAGAAAATLPDAQDHARIPAGEARSPPRVRDPSPEHLHDWRKRVKDLWYHLRLLRDAWTDAMKAHRRAVRGSSRSSSAIDH